MGSLTLSDRAQGQGSNSVKVWGFDRITAELSLFITVTEMAS